MYLHYYFLLITMFWAFTYSNDMLRSSALRKTPMVRLFRSTSRIVPDSERALLRGLNPPVRKELIILPVMLIITMNGACKFFTNLEKKRNVLNAHSRKQS